MSGCPHYYCRECIQSMVEQKLKDGQIAKLICADKTCKKPLNDRDIKNLKLDKELEKKYEKLSVENAIEQMSDMGWCPLTTCK